MLRLRAGHSRPGVEELTVFLRDRIDPHKTPVIWAVRDELPVTASGKIQKFLLREDLAKGLLAWDEVHLTGEPSTPACESDRTDRTAGSAVHRHELGFP